MDFRASIISQRGSALVFALGLCTLVVILATSMILALNHDMRRFDKLKDAVMEQSASKSATAWALSIVEDESIVNKVAEKYEKEINGMTIHATMIDMDGLFNVNTLTQIDAPNIFSAKEIFKRLGKLLNVDIDKIATMTESVQVISQIKKNELSQETYDILLPFIRANDIKQRAMNVNTMSATLMGALLDIEESEGESLIELGPFQSEAEFNQGLAQLALDIPPGGLSHWLKYDSEQYLIHTMIKAKGTTEIYTVLTKTTDGWDVVYQSNGVRI